MEFSLTIFQIFLLILAPLVVHWLADAVLQTEEQAQNKHHSWKALLGHTFVYSYTWSIFFSLVSLANHYWFGFTLWSQGEHVGWMLIVIFPIITFVCHTITDYFTSRVNTKLAIEAKETGKWHNFFVMVLFDQLLHYIQIYGTIALCIALASSL